MAGRGANVIEGAELIAVSSENSKYLKDKAYDGFPGSPFKFDAAGVDDTYDIDLNRVPGDMESWDVPARPDGWTDASNDTGNLQEETSIVHGGTSALFLEGKGSGKEAIAQYDETVLSGWRMTIGLKDILNALAGEVVGKLLG